jgi:hypothetical protein
MSFKTQSSKLKTQDFIDRVAWLTWRQELWSLGGEGRPQGRPPKNVMLQAELQSGEDATRESRTGSAIGLVERLG